MPRSRFASKKLWSSSRVLLLAGVVFGVLFISVGQPTLAGGMAYECQTGCDTDTPTPTPTPTPPARTAPAQSVRDDREEDRRALGIQECCRRLIESRPLRGAYCSRRLLRQSVRECPLSIRGRVAQILSLPSERATFRQSNFLRQSATVRRNTNRRQIAARRRNATRHHGAAHRHGTTPPLLRILIVPQVLHLFGI